MAEIVRKPQQHFARRFSVPSRAFLWPFDARSFGFVLIRVHSWLPSFGCGSPLCVHRASAVFPSCPIFLPSIFLSQCFCPHLFACSAFCCGSGVLCSLESCT